MENLPQDIMFDLFSRFSVKYVLQFRCVCKSWCSLISKPEFVKTHLHRAITEDGSVGCRRLLIPKNYMRKSSGISLESIDYEALQLLSEQKLKEARNNKGGNACTLLDFPHSGPGHRVSLVGYCHGMVGLVVDYDKIVICNPCTREFRELPKPTCMPFECMKYCGGLGHDSSVDDYKFVIAVVVEGIRGIKAEVFSLRSSYSWRMLHDDIEPDISSFFGVNNESGLFLNGALHWIASCKTGQMIISFDLATEKFQEPFPVPGGYEYPLYPLYKDLIILGGCLSVSDSSSSYDTQVWIMKEYGVEASWTKLFTLDLRFNMDYVHYLSPLGFSKNGELLVNVDSQIRIYNPKEQNSRKLYKGSLCLQKLTLYIESLVSPNGNGEKKK